MNYNVVAPERGKTYAATAQGVQENKNLLKLVQLEQSEIELLCRQIESKLAYECDMIDQLQYVADLAAEHGSIQAAIAFHQTRCEQLATKLQRLEADLRD